MEGDLLELDAPRAGSGSFAGLAGARMSGSAWSSSDSRSDAPAARSRSP